MLVDFSFECQKKGVKELNLSQDPSPGGSWPAADVYFCVYAFLVANDRFLSSISSNVSNARFTAS